MTEEHVLVFYDKVTLEPRIVLVNEAGEDGTWMVEGTDAPEGMARAHVPKREVRDPNFPDEVRHLNFYRMAEKAILKKEGRSPPLPDGV